MSSSTITLTRATFDRDVLASDVPVVVDFWAAWCGPCRLISPLVEDLADDFAGRANVAKLNIDDYPEIASRYGVSAVPTLLYFHHGQVVDRVIGAEPLRVLTSKLEALLAQPPVPAQAA